ncbi:hypothetical protein CDD82_7992 [Ophiocordyceps australis]|uniref:E3 ubiquitin-protein ligase synoviolin-like TPR repeats domain-containing protein n=1 Tax=Ophiocordyceps australis TaxID=1399860 RepID=A0A2C5YN01_9HYPO|nr:hypothetical protein CDD82_7992 [Ophiocordyceps australis]
MRLGWYAGVSTALAGGVVMSAFYQRANYYSAMVYLAQSNFCLLVLVNFSLLVYSSFIYALTRLCYGTLRAVEVEQLTERAWFAITETCLAMTIFREEIGAWFLVMFTALITGKVWGWIGDGRVEFLEQQPPQNPRLFHIRLSLSLSLSFVYDVCILLYTINSVIQQARPNMMVMFLFEFAVLATCSWRTGVRYIIALVEQSIIKSQTKQRLLERRQEVRQRRQAMIRQRETRSAAGEHSTADQGPLPNEDDVDEMDIEVPGWAAKGELVLWLDLLTDMIKLGIYVAFFFMLLMFYGLPIHIMRDLFMTSRDFVKRLNALLRYRRAIQEMNRYPDATVDELAQENTCIICREDMRPWDPINDSGAIDRVCPTCRSPVTADRPGPTQFREAGVRVQIGGMPRLQGQQPPAINDNAPPAARDRPNAEAPQPPRNGGARVFNLGPIRLGFGANAQQFRDMAQQFGIPNMAVNPHATPALPETQPTLTDNLHNISNLVHQSEQIIQREAQRLQMAQQELQVAHLLMTEWQRIYQRRLQPHETAQPGGSQVSAMVPNTINNALPAPLFPPAPAPIPGQLPTIAAIPMLHAAPQRTETPLVARLRPPDNAAAISAGSPDLPEGLTLPPGWSLMPLQRLDGVPTSSQPALRPATPLGSGVSNHVRPATDSAPGTSTGPTIGSGPRDEDQSLFESAGEAGVSNRSTEMASAAVPSEPHALSPTSLMPTWSGAAQLLNRARQAESSRASIPESSTSEQHNMHDATPTDEPFRDEMPTRAEDTAPCSSSKGKARAVTVEEARDDDDD